MEKKALSSLLLIVLLVFVVISLTSFTYIFLMQNTSEFKSEIESKQTSSLRKLNSCIEFVSFDNDTNTLYVRNCGKYNLKNVSVIMDNVPSLEIDEIKPGETKHVALSAYVGEHEVKLLNDYVSSTSYIKVTKYTGPQCSDGTPFGQCSFIKPKYCDSGTLVDKCSVCGCSSGTCMPDGTCSAPFDFSISTTPTSGLVEAGSSIDTTVTATLLSGTANPVILSCSGLPSGASCSFSPSTITPTSSSTLTISTDATTPTGTYSITISGTDGATTKTTNYDLAVVVSWFGSWLYRMPVTITSIAMLTDYQVLVTADTASLISAGKMKSDCSDIRFTDFTGVTEISHWIEPGTCNSASTRIWVKVPSIPIPGTKIYMYYGNPSAISESNGTATFEFFNLSSVTEVDPNSQVGVSSSTISWTGLHPMNLPIGTYTYKQIQPLQNYIYDFEYKLTGGGSSAENDAHVYFAGVGDTAGSVCDSSNQIGAYLYYAPHCCGAHLSLVQRTNGVDDISAGIGINPGTLYYGTITRNGTTGTLSLYSDASRTIHISGSPVTLTVSNASMNYVLPMSQSSSASSSPCDTSNYYYGKNNGWSSGFVQNIRVRKYASPEPTASVGAEEAKP